MSEEQEETVCEGTENIIAHDVPIAVSLLKELIQQTDTTKNSVKTLLKRVQNDEFQTTKGISFLEVKYQLLLSYLIDMTYLIHRKLTGNSIEGNDSIDRLIEIRTVLEKMRPIDHKLKYQIDKLLKSTVVGNINPDDPIHLKPNITNTFNKIDEDIDESESNSESEEEKEKKPKAKIYVAPKLAAMKYDGDETIQDKRQKLLEKAKKRALHSSIMQELRRECDDAPEEISDSVGRHRQKQNKEMKERQEYEETYMMRMPLTKKQKHNSQRLATISSLGNLARFEDISALDANIDDMIPMKKKKTSKKLTKKKGKRKAFRRKKH